MKTNQGKLSFGLDVFIYCPFETSRLAVHGQRLVAGDVRGNLMKWELGEEDGLVGGTQLLVTNGLNY